MLKLLEQLHYTIINKKDVREVAEQLLNIKPDEINEALADSNTPLHLVLNWLLSEKKSRRNLSSIIYGLKMKIRNHNFSYKIEILKLFLARGASVNKVGRFGKTPLEVLLKYSYRLKLQTFQSMLELFLEKGADVNVVEHFFKCASSYDQYGDLANAALVKLRFSKINTDDILEARSDLYNSTEHLIKPEEKSNKGSNCTESSSPTKQWSPSFTSFFKSLSSKSDATTDEKQPLIVDSINYSITSLNN